jgi:hypothetical protein
MIKLLGKLAYLRIYVNFEIIMKSSKISYLHVFKKSIALVAVIVLSHAALAVDGIIIKSKSTQNTPAAPLLPLEGEGSARKVVPEPPHLREVLLLLPRAAGAGAAAAAAALDEGPSLLVKWLGLSLKVEVFFLLSLSR